MYKRMLVPLDGSEIAEVAFNYAKKLACRIQGMELILLHIYTPRERELAPMYRIYIEQAADTIRRQSEEVQQTGIQSGVKAVKVQGELAVGSPAKEILRYADRNDVDLILMATHGRSGISRWVMGSVAYKVLHSSKVPVWLVRAEISEEIVQDKLPTRTILVPLDESKLAESVLPHVEALAKQWGDGQIEVVLLRVCEPPVISSDYPPSMPLSWEKHVEMETAKCIWVAEPYLAKIEKRLKDAGLKVRKEVLTGQPDEKIVDYASRNNFSLIVMATHGRSGISRLAYGSVAEKVMLGTPTPIFLVVVVRVA